MGFHVGDNEGELERVQVGSEVGTKVGISVVGTLVGAPEGALVGALEGAAVGSASNFKITGGLRSIPQAVFQRGSESKAQCEFSEQTRQSSGLG